MHHTFIIHSSVTDILESSGLLFPEYGEQSSNQHGWVGVSKVSNGLWVYAREWFSWRSMSASRGREISKWLVKGREKKAYREFVE